MQIVVEDAILPTHICESDEISNILKIDIDKFININKIFIEMIKARITVFHDELKNAQLLYEGMIKDDQRRIIYHDATGGYNEVNIEVLNTIKIRRICEGFKSNIVLSKSASSAHIVTNEGEIDIPIKLLELEFGSERVYACYDTGEKIAIQIDLMKE